MSLSRDLISQFIKATNDQSKTSNESTIYGTIKEVNDKLWIQLDGSDILTPLPELAHQTTKVSNGERVTASIKNHQIIVTGNLDSPAARWVKSYDDKGNQVLTVEDINVPQLNAKIIEVETVLTKNLNSTNATVSKLTADVANLNELITGEIDAGIVNTDQLNAAIANVTQLNANDIAAVTGRIDNLLSANGDIGKLQSRVASIEELQGDVATITYVNTEVTNTRDLVTENVTALNARIDNVESDYVKTDSIEGKYANIDFSNITKATMQWFYANSGLIKGVVVGEGTITGELVGVTISGDLIQGNTVKADKLVIKGSDGLYYKLNFDAGTFQNGEVIPQDSLHGSIITAKSITADKVSVTDLVAFGATIGGFKITDNSLYSGTKESATNTTRGVYFDNTGQFAIGDASNYLKYFKDTDGRYKLDISAQSISIKSDDTTTNIEDAFDDIKAATVVDTTVMYALSDSLTAEPTSGWSAIAPEWTTGKYMWQKTVTTYGNGSKKESDPTCISGASGQNGEDATVLRIDSSRGTVFKNNTVETVLSVVIYNGPRRITDITTLKSIYGSGAYLQWSWQRMDENRFGDILSTDPRIGNDGFSFTLSTEDVDTKVVFMCSLII